MTREEKLEAIKTRLGEASKDFQPLHVSVLILIGYIEKLKQNGILDEGEVQTTQVGRNALAICQDFDWKPTDVEIVQFCKDMVDQSQMEQFVLMLREMRDDQDGFIERAKQNKSSQ